MVVSEIEKIVSMLPLDRQCFALPTYLLVGDQKCVGSWEYVRVSANPLEWSCR